MTHFRQHRQPWEVYSLITLSGDQATIKKIWGWAEEEHAHTRKKENICSSTSCQQSEEIFEEEKFYIDMACQIDTWLEFLSKENKKKIFVSVYAWSKGREKTTTKTNYIIKCKFVFSHLNFCLLSFCNSFSLNPFYLVRKLMIISNLKVSLRRFRLARTGRWETQFCRVGPFDILT